MLSDYDESLLSQINQIDDIAMLDLGSQSPLSQEVVNLVTQDLAPIEAKEEFPADEGTPPAQENLLLVYLIVGVQAIEHAVKGLFQFEEKRCNKAMLLKLQMEAINPRHTKKNIKGRS